MLFIKIAEFAHAIFKFKGECLTALRFFMCFKILPRFGGQKIAKIKFLSKGN